MKPLTGVARGVLKRKMELAKEDNTSKKQRVKEATVTAMEVMNRLLAPDGDAGHDVSDAEWERLVQLTQEHEYFDKFFTFPEDASDWVKPKKKKKRKHLKVVALDCEMCVTVKKGARERTSNALCRVSAVDGEDILGGIVSDFIVHQPEDGFHMVDPKTNIHGITANQIASSSITTKQAQKKMLKYINQDTIVVGHSVHNDLVSLRINHRRVIDTSMIFQRKVGNPSQATPGLKDLTKFLLGFDMPQGHDSTVDAQASMMAAKFAVRHETGCIIPSALELHGHGAKQQLKVTPVTTEYTGPVMLIETAFQSSKPISKSVKRTVSKGPVNKASYIDMAAITKEVSMQARTATRMSEAMIARSCRLRVHRIPKGLSSKDIEKFFLETTMVVPTAVEKIAWLPDQNRGSCNVTFPSNAHAALAFESATGPDDKTKVTNDSIGRPQKTIAVTSFMGKTYKNVALGTF